MDLRIQLNNALNVPIQNFEEFSLDFSFNDFSPNPNILTNFMPEFWATKDGVDAYNYILNFMATLPGSNMNAPVIDLDSGIQLQNTFLNFGSSSNEFDLKRARMKIELSTYNNSFLEVAGGLKLKTYYKSRDFVKTTYVRNKVPDYVESALLTIAIYMTIQTSIQIVKDTIYQVEKAIPAGPTDFTVFLRVALIILANALYLTLILIALFNLLKGLSEAIFGKPRTYYAVDVFDVLRQGCESLGFTLDSSEEANLKNLTYMAAWGPKNNDQIGVLRGNPVNNPLPDITLLEFFNRIGKLINAKLKVRTDNVIQFERKTTFEQTPTNLVLGDIWDKGTFHYNSDELNQAIGINFLNAFQDGNISDNKFLVMFVTDNMKAQVIKNFPVDSRQSVEDVSINAISSKILTNVKNRLDVDLPFAAAVRKTETKPLETLFNSIFDVITGINNESRLDVGERKNLMLLENDNVPSDLIYFRDGQKLAAKTTSFLTAKNIFSTYYHDETPFENQYVTHVSRGPETVLSRDTVIELVNNNIARNEEGRIVYITKNMKNTQTDLHEFEYKQKLQQGDFYFQPQENFEVFVVEDDDPVQKKFDWQQFITYLVG